MATIIYDPVDPVTLTGYARTIPEPAEYGLARYLRPREIPSIEYDFTTRTRTNRAAVYRAYDAETPIGKRDGFSRTKGAIPPLGEKRVIGEFDTIMLEIARGADDSRLIEEIYNDTESNTLAIRARLELARGDVLDDGKFTLDAENGLTIEVDFNVPVTNFVNAAVPWSNHGGAGALDELMAWTAAATLAAGSPPVVGITSTTVLGHVQRNEQVRTQGAGNVLGVPAIASQPQTQALLASYGVPPLIAMDHFIDVDGVTTRVLDEGKIHFLSAAEVGRTVMGITAEAIALVRARRLNFDDAPGIIAVVQEEGDPVRTWSKAGCTGMPVLTKPDGLFVADVL